MTAAGEGRRLVWWQWLVVALVALPVVSVLYAIEVIWSALSGASAPQEEK